MLWLVTAGLASLTPSAARVFWLDLAAHLLGGSGVDGTALVLGAALALSAILVTAVAVAHGRRPALAGPTIVGPTDGGQRWRRFGAPRHADPDAPGRPRPRAPSPAALAG